ncbi:MAG: lipid A-modifier LpxR family protein [Hyphomicrobiales bacterium]
MFGRVIVTLSILFFASSPAAAQMRPQLPGEFRIYEENDYFNFVTEQTDVYYTQGARVENLYASDESATHLLPGIPFDALCLACGRNLGNRAVNTGWAIGQNIYTPRDIEIAAPQPYDRPWAGLLYVSRVARFTFHDPTTGRGRQDRVEVSVGMVGSAALAGPAQTRWHEIIGSPRPASS